MFIEASRDKEDLIDNNIIWNVEGRFDRDAVPAEAGSSGWYKNTEAGTVKNGYGIYLEGTDRQRIVGNLIGKCNYAGFFAKTVPFRIMRMKRGGTTRENRFFGNLFYECGDAAIILPNDHNEAEGNAYVKMPGGFLRVMYPEPELCLDLPAWQEFCGFDLDGSTPDLDIDIDTAALTMAVTVRGGPARDPCGPRGRDGLFRQGDREKARARPDRRPGGADNAVLDRPEASRGVGVSFWRDRRVWIRPSVRNGYDKIAAKHKSRWTIVYEPLPPLYLTLPRIPRRPAIPRPIVTLSIAHGIFHFVNPA